MSEEATKYVCKREDLDLLLPDELKQKFWDLFPEPTSEKYVAWRMYYGDHTPKSNLAEFGINYEHPTVRDAVAFDLVKLDDNSVSNDSDYTFKEHMAYSPMEYDRYLFNKNYRVNLVCLEPEWSRITYTDEDQGSSSSSYSPESEIWQIVHEPGQREGDGSSSDGETVLKRTVEMLYQGVRLSDDWLEYFQKVMEKGSADGVYIPFTNANDIT